MLLDSIKKEGKTLAQSDKYKVVLWDDQHYLVKNLWALAVDQKGADNICLEMAAGDNTIVESLDISIGNRCGMFLIHRDYGLIPGCDSCGNKLALVEDTLGRYYMLCSVCGWEEQIPEEDIRLIAEDWLI